MFDAGTGQLTAPREDWKHIAIESLRTRRGDSGSAADSKSIFALSDSLSCFAKANYCTLDALYLNASLLVPDVCAADSAEVALINDLCKTAAALQRMIHQHSMLSYRYEVICQKTKWLITMTSRDESNQYPIRKCIREDLITEAIEAENSCKDVDIRLNTCQDEMQKLLDSLQRTSVTVKNAADLCKIVASELQISGVFGAATRKLIMSDILSEIFSRLEACVLCTSAKPQISNLKPWSSLLTEFCAMRQKQELVYSATYKALASTSDSSQISGQISFNLATGGCNMSLEDVTPNDSKFILDSSQHSGESELVNDEFIDHGVCSAGFGNSRFSVLPSSLNETGEIALSAESSAESKNLL